MQNTNQMKPAFSASNETLLRLLEMLSDALFVIDNNAMIGYANAHAQTLAGATQEDLIGKSLWTCAPHLVSTSLYQAVQQAWRTQEPTEIAYCSPVSNTWLQVSLCPIDEGLALVFQHSLERLPTRHKQMDRDLLESLADGVTILTPDGLVLDINWRPLAAAHLQREEVVGKPFANLPAWSHDPEVQQLLQVAVARAGQGETVRFEARIHPRKDLPLDILMTITSHRDANQRVDYLICVGRDITERKRAEDELHTLIDAIPHFVWIMRPDGISEYGNQRWRDYTAMTPEQYLGNGWLQAIHPDDQQLTMTIWRRACMLGEPFEIEYRVKDGHAGTYRWFLARAVPVRDETGRILKWIGTCTDIEAQKQAEQQLKESRENFRVLAETVPQLIWTARAEDGLSDYFNQRFCDYTRATQEQLYGYGWSQFLHPEDAERTLEARAHALSAGVPYEVEYRFREGQTGHYRWFLARAMPIRDEAGQILKWFGTSTDIDEQKQTEQALRQSQERIRALIDSNIIGIISTELEGEVIVDANDAWLHLTGYTREDVRSRTLNRAKITPPEQEPLFEHATRELTAYGQHMPFETELVCKDGSRLPIVAGGVLFQDQSRQVVSFVLDNSARKELEQRKDDFISMASHELRNPLAAMKLQTALLHRQLARQDMLDEVPALTRIETQLHKTTRLVEELLDVSKIQAGGLEYVWEKVDLDPLLRETAETMQQTHPGHAIIVRGAVQTSLHGDRDRLGQVFTNLLSNAIKYSPDAQTVEMDLSATPETVTIQVHDHGMGIPQEQREKIFERFYRAAGSRQRAIPGLGMGLYIVAEIVKRHGGTITVDSVLGEGSTFTVILPNSGHYD